MPLRQVRPESAEVDQPMPAAPPSAKRPTWNDATAVVPAPATLGSTCVWCCAPALVSESEEIRRETSSQSPATVSARSAVTASTPLPHCTRSVPPYTASIRSAFLVPLIRCTEDAAATTGASSTRAISAKAVDTRTGSTYRRRYDPLALGTGLETIQPGDFRRRRHLGDRRRGRT